jgi:hypothetical protein
MKTVYLVTSGYSSDDYSIQCIFSTIENAEFFIAQGPSDDYNEPEMAKQRRMVHLFVMDKAGTVQQHYTWFPTKHALAVVNTIGQNHDRIWLRILADSEENALIEARKQLEWVKEKHAPWRRGGEYRDGNIPYKP